MTTTIEDANAALRKAVKTRLTATPADDPKLVGYTSTDEFAQFRGAGILNEGSGSAAFLELLDRIRELHCEKTASYGDADDPFANVTASAKCGVEPWRRALCDASDCLVRLQRYANGQPVDFDNAVMDGINWLLICWLKHNEERDAH